MELNMGLGNLGLEDKFAIIVCCSPSFWSTSDDGSANSNLASILSLFFYVFNSWRYILRKERKMDKEG